MTEECRHGLERELERMKHERDELEQRALARAARLTDLEQELASDRQALEAERATLQLVLSTRLWRWGTAYWRFRDKLLRRGR